MRCRGSGSGAPRRRRRWPASARSSSAPPGPLDARRDGGRQGGRGSAAQRRGRHRRRGVVVAHAPERAVGRQARRERVPEPRRGGHRGLRRRARGEPEAECEARRAAHRRHSLFQEAEHQ
jgi:hypothetical protein